MSDDSNYQAFERTVSRVLSGHGMGWVFGLDSWSRRKQIQTAWQMASEEWTIEAIRKHLELPEDGGWQEVRKHVDSWLGTKNQIMYRLNALTEEPDADKRNELKCELEERINFIYYQAKDLADKTARIREALDS